MYFVEYKYTFKDSATDMIFFCIWCVSLIEVTVQNFRLFFLIETDLKCFLMY